MQRARYGAPYPYGGSSIDTTIDLFAVGVADPHNGVALAAAAAMFGGKFQELSSKEAATQLPALAGQYDLVIALDNVLGAKNLFAYRPPAGARIALLAGNERRGLPAAAIGAATAVLQIPMRPGVGASLNVAAAVAVALWHLRTAGQRRPRGSRGKPEIVLAHPGDPAELGSALRSAWALGWSRCGVLDSRCAWFTNSRAVFAAGRGASRRHKNDLRVYPWSGSPPDNALLVGASGAGVPLWSAAIPPGTVVCIPDESADGPLWPEARRVTLGLPPSGYPYHYRLLASLTLAEIARRG